MEPTLTSLGFRFNPNSRAFKGAGQAPLRKAINYALDRRALTRAHGYLGARRSDRLVPAPLSERRALYSLDGPDLVTAGEWLARAGHRPPTLTLYTATLYFSLPTAHEFASNLRQLGIAVDVKAFDLATLTEKLGTKGEPWDVGPLRGAAAYPHPAAALVPLIRGTKDAARINAANRVTGATRAKSWADLEAYLMSNDPPGAVYGDFTPLYLVSPNFGCWRSGYGLDLGAVCKK